MGENRGTNRVLMEKYEKTDHLDDPGLNEWIILKWIY
jgi:hypothetical protein